ncbi:MAG: GGDEF domain-containing protein [Amphritea sp.]
MSLLTKILLWMFPVVLPVMGFTWSYYQAQMQATAEQVGNIASLVSSSGSRELNDFLRLRASEFSLLRTRLDICKDQRRGGNYELLARDALAQTRGFSVLAIADTEGRVVTAKIASSYSNRHILPHSLSATQLLSDEEFLAMRQAWLAWQQRVPALRMEKNRVFMEALGLESRGEVNSQHYSHLLAKVFNLTQLVSIPPTHISYSGGELADAMGLPYRRDSFLFTQPLLDCEDQLQGYLTAFMDRSQVEDILLLLRKSLADRGITQADVALIDGDLNRFESDVRLLTVSQLQQLDGLPDDKAEYVPQLKGYLSVANIADKEILGVLMRQEETSERGVSDQDYKRLIESDSKLHLLVFVAEQEWQKRGQVLLFKVSIWLLGSMLFLFVLIYFLARHIVAPIIRLKESVKLVAEGNRAVQAEVSSGDEVGQLAQAFNRMTAALKCSEEELKRLATIDSLTGLLNRRALMEEARKERHRANRSGSVITIAMLDLDHFKRINDSYGHAAGDTVLQNFASILKQQLRVTDYIGRIGGEEFVIVLPETDLDSGYRLIEKIKGRVITQIFQLDDEATISITFSAGVVAWNREEDFEDVLRQADSKLYQAKQSGRNKVIS